MCFPLFKKLYGATLRRKQTTLYLKVLSDLPRQYNFIYVACDTYKVQSIKDSERSLLYRSLKESVGWTACISRKICVFYAKGSPYIGNMRAKIRCSWIFSVGCGRRCMCLMRCLVLLKSTCASCMEKRKLKK